VTVLAEAIAGLDQGTRELGRQVPTVRWVIVITLVGQLLFLGPEQIVPNTSRVVAAVAIAVLLVITTRVRALLETVERGLRPFERFRVDPQRVALRLTVNLSTIPVLARLASEIRDAQRVRGAPASLRFFVVPFVVVLKYADELGDALTARTRNERRRSRILGPAVDEEPGCIHQRSPLDVIAIKFAYRRLRA
jgi:biotin transport system permease protein